jgi:ribosomal protein S18 acetylase RimI-like enzyme
MIALNCYRMRFEIVPAHEVPLSDQATVFTKAFAGYVAGSFQFDERSISTFLCAQGIDLCYSRFARDDSGQLVSFGYINRTGGITRLAGMGTVSAARRTGAAGFIVSQLLDEAKERNDQAMVLEVIEQNPPAVALYRAQGFDQVTRLFGWRTSGDQPTEPSDDLREISVIEALRLPPNLDYPDLPWQVSRHAVAKIASVRVFASGDAAVAIGNPDTPPIRIYAYLGGGNNLWESFRRLTTALLAKFPGVEFYASPIFPEQFGTEVFGPLKFKKEPLNQFLMRKDL